MYHDRRDSHEPYYRTRTAYAVILTTLEQGKDRIKGARAPVGFGGFLKVYFIQALTANKLKVGISQCPESRLSAMQTGSAFPLSLVGSLDAQSRKHAADIERRIHQALRAYHIKGEWFKYSAQVREFVKAALSGDAPSTMAALKKLSKKAWGAHKGPAYKFSARRG